MQVGIVVNPHAGRRVALARAEHAARHARSAGCACEIACTTAAGAASTLATEMARAGCDVVVAAGGDGTINEVAQGLLGTGTALGVVPAGLANVWALDLGLVGASGSLDRLLREGRVFDTDVGMVNGRAFLMMAGIGFDAAVVDAVRSEDKQRWAQLAYLGSAAARIGRWERVTARIQADASAERTLDLFGVIVTNVNKYGGVLDLAPDSKLDDGLVDALVVRDAGPARRVRSALLAGHRTRRWDGCAETIRCRNLRIVTDRPLLVHTDAEMAGTTPCEIRVLSRALPVLLPASAQQRYLTPGRPVQALSSRSYSVSGMDPTP